ncbi:MAG TPA: HAMP domain-containing sensor histidine kinase [Terriglobales bacterium]|nr:HAMP domain-containing sensor histidine kinase [Terriglobales bacterium]
MAYLSSVLQEIFPALQNRSVLSEELAEKAQWLIKLRRVAIAAQLLCIAPGLLFELLQPSDLPIYLAIIAGLGVFNWIAPRAMRRFALSSEWHLFGHLAVDLAALGALLALSSGCHNPLVALIYLNAALGPLILSGARNAAFLAATCVCLVMICYLTDMPLHSMPGAALPREIKLAAELTVVGLIWQLTRWVAGHLASLSRSIDALEHRKIRVDNLRALGAMAATFSHEFATPLNTVKLRLERIRRRPNGVNGTEDDVNGALAGMRQCETVLRSLFATEPSAKSPAAEPIALAPFVESVCRAWQRDHSQVTLDVSPATSAHGATCRVPSLVLARSLIDLLDNAVEASPAGARIDVSLRADVALARIAIEDRGCGMPSEVKARIGEPFVTTRASGAGLGLFTARSFAEAFGGGLEIRDRAGGGTVVALTLPVDDRGAP